MTPNVGTAMRFSLIFSSVSESCCIALVLFACDEECWNQLPEEAQTEMLLEFRATAAALYAGMEALETLTGRASSAIEQVYYEAGWILHSHCTTNCTLNLST